MASRSGPGGTFHTEPTTPAPRFEHGAGDGASAGDIARVAKREFLTAETKPGVFTTEFVLTFLVGLGVLISAAAADGFSAERAWFFVSLLTIGYVISRGFAKAGVRHADRDHQH